MTVPAGLFRIAEVEATRPADGVTESLAAEGVSGALLLPKPRFSAPDSPTNLPTGDAGAYRKEEITKAGGVGGVFGNIFADEASSGQSGKSGSLICARKNRLEGVTGKTGDKTAMSIDLANERFENRY